jgi:F-type H+-transporting ATPase subunit b
MLSRLAFNKAGGIARLLTRDGQQRFAVIIPLTRGASQVAHEPEKAPAKSSSDDGSEIAKTLANWEAANKIYFGPERDTVNFPIKKQPLTAPPVRLGFIPDSWFQAFYPKTGVTGPYVFGVGFLTYVMSKEIWIVEHNFTHFLAFWIAFYIIAKKGGPAIAKYYDTHNEALDNRHWYAPLNKTKDEFKKNIEELEKGIWREDGQTYLFESKRENVDLQLESVYRQRLSEVHQAVKKRLDYQVDVETTKRRLQQQHMVQWIVDGVMAGITPQQEKDSMSKCIQDLKNLASKSKAAMA